MSDNSRIKELRAMKKLGVSSYSQGAYDESFSVEFWPEDLQQPVTLQKTVLPRLPTGAQNMSHRTLLEKLPEGARVLAGGDAEDARKEEEDVLYYSA